MEQTLNCCISENEDIITVGAGVTLSVMAESELLKREAKPLFDAAVMLTEGRKHWRTQRWIQRWKHRRTKTPA